MDLTDDNGKSDDSRERFREGGTYGKRKKVCDNEKLENKDSIVFLLLLNTGQKVVWDLVSYKFLSICRVHHSLFYFILSLSHFLNQTLYKYFCVV